MNEEIQKRIKDEAILIRERLHQSYVYLEAIDENDEDMMLVAAYLLGISDEAKQNK